LQQGEILREEFDLDRIGRTGEIADHVFEHLVKIGIELRILLVHFVANVRDNFFDTTAPF